MNLCFILVLITLLALRQSAVVFAPDAFSNESASDHGLFKAYWNVNPVTRELRAILGYLSDWRQRSRILNEWFLEYKNASWERFRAAQSAEFDLVEARRHIANAEVFGVVTGEKRRAKIELVNANSDLQKALAGIARGLKPVANAIFAEIAQTKLDLEMDRLDSEINNDEQIKNDLDSLIQLLRSKSFQPVSES